MGARGGRAQAGQGALAQAGGLPMRGDAPRLTNLLFEPGGHLAMGVARQQRRDAGQHRLVHQVVCKGRAAQDLAAFQLGPGIGHGQSRLLQHHLGQADREVNPGNGGHARQLQGGRAQGGQGGVDQLTDIARPWQGAVFEGMAFAPGQLQGLQREQRIATAARMQQGRQPGTADAG